MGIVVCFVMGLGLIAFMPMPWREPDNKPADRSALLKRIDSIAPAALIMIGTWNTFWYGLQNLGKFWGTAALISGILMILSAIVLTGREKRPALISTIYRLLNPIRIPLFVGLLASFGLYLVTLIQLNLGLPIIS